MSKSFYEVVPYERANFVVSTGTATYSVPHIHREFELGIVFQNVIELNTENTEPCVVHTDEFFLINPWERHEYKAASFEKEYGFILIQFPFSMFQQWCPSISQLRFDSARLTRESMGDTSYDRLRMLLLDIAQNYYEHRNNFELCCAGSIFYLMKELLENVPHTFVNAENIQAEHMKLQRMHRISEYIDAHANEKLELQDIAKEEGVTLNYLSYYFKTCWGMPFLTYLQRIRCIRAAELLRATTKTATDIALTCGFSALKYMNRGFEEIFGMSPGAYRKYHSTESRTPIITAGVQTDFPTADPKAIPGSGSPFAPMMSPEESLAIVRMLKQ